jgi:hypothetical protein
MDTHPRVARTRSTRSFCELHRPLARSSDTVGFPAERVIYIEYFMEKRNTCVASEGGGEGGTLVPQREG